MFHKINTYLILDNNDWGKFDGLRHIAVDLLHALMSLSILHYPTYNSETVGVKAGKWSHDRKYGIAGKRGWFVGLTYSRKGKKFVLQVRYDN